MRKPIFVAILLALFIGTSSIITADIIKKKIEVCFTPPSGCEKVIVNHISSAKKTIYVQAYGFTSNDIIEELIVAKKRGVVVNVLLDKSNLYGKHSKIDILKKAGINVQIDKVQGIAHNKVMIIDEQTIITGSFNFTKNADTKNAENIVIIKDRDIAEKYFKNWLLRNSKNK